MEIKKNAYVRLWNGDSGKVLSVIGSKLNILLASGVRKCVESSQVVEAEYDEKFEVAQKQLKAFKEKQAGNQEPDEWKLDKVEAKAVDNRYGLKQASAESFDEVFAFAKDASIEKVAPGKVDEGIWEKAKNKVKEEYGKLEGNWAIVNHIYQNMGGTFKSKSSLETTADAPIVQTVEKTTEHFVDGKPAEKTIEKTIVKGAKEQVETKVAGHPKDLAEADALYSRGDTLIPASNKDEGDSGQAMHILDVKVEDKVYVVEKRDKVEDKEREQNETFGVRFEIPIATLDKDKDWVRFAVKKVADKERAKGEMVKVNFDGYDYYIRAIDSTHAYMFPVENLESERFGIPMHVGQFNSKELSDAVYQWLGGADFDENKKYVFGAKKVADIEEKDEEDIIKEVVESWSPSPATDDNKNWESQVTAIADVVRNLIKEKGMDEALKELETNYINKFDEGTDRREMVHSFLTALKGEVVVYVFDDKDMVADFYVSSKLSDEEVDKLVKEKYPEASYWTRTMVPNKNEHYIKASIKVAILSQDEVIKGLSPIEEGIYDDAIDAFKDVDKALESIVNTVEGDESQVSPKLLAYAKEKGWLEGFNVEATKIAIKSPVRKSLDYGELPFKASDLEVTSVKMDNGGTIFTLTNGSISFDAEGKATTTVAGVTDAQIAEFGNMVKTFGVEKLASMVAIKRLNHKKIILSKKVPHGLKAGDQVKLAEDALQQHSRSVPPHAGYTTEQFSWRDTLDKHLGQVGTVERTFGDSGEVNVQFDDGTLIGVDGSQLVKQASLDIERLEKKKANLSKVADVETEEAKAVAMEICKQMGGIGKLQAMLGAKNFVIVNKQRGGVYFQFPNKGAGKPNLVEIVLNGLDTYDVTFKRIRGTDLNIVKEVSGVYNDGLIPLFEETTGLYLNFNPTYGSKSILSGLQNNPIARLKKKAARLGNWDFDKHDPIWKLQAGEDGKKKLVRTNAI